MGRDWVNRTLLCRLGQPNIAPMLRTDTVGIHRQVYRCTMDNLRFRVVFDADDSREAHEYEYGKSHARLPKSHCGENPSAHTRGSALCSSKRDGICGPIFCAEGNHGKCLGADFWRCNCSREHRNSGIGCP